VLGELNLLNRGEVHGAEVSGEVAVGLLQVLKGLGEFFLELGDFGLRG